MKRQGFGPNDVLVISSRVSASRQGALPREMVDDFGRSFLPIARLLAAAISLANLGARFAFQIHYYETEVAN